MSGTRLTMTTPLRGVLGDRTAKVLGKALDLHTVGDLVSHYPRRYQKRGELSRLDALPLETDVTIVADVLRAGSRSMMNRRGTRQEVLISDGSGTLTLVVLQPAVPGRPDEDAGTGVGRARPVHRAGGFSTGR